MSTRPESPTKRARESKESKEAKEAKVAEPVAPPPGPPVTIRPFSSLYFFPFSIHVFAGVNVIQAKQLFSVQEKDKKKKKPGEKIAAPAKKKPAAGVEEKKEEEVPAVKTALIVSLESEKKEARLCPCTLPASLDSLLSSQSGVLSDKVAPAYNFSHTFTTYKTEVRFAFSFDAMIHSSLLL